MKAIVKYRDGKIELAELPMPKAGPGEAVVRVFYSGICKTDIRVADGTLPAKKDGIVLGHEFSGEVVEVGPRPDEFRRGFGVGDFVVANPMLSLATDEMLGKDADGCFAEYVVIPTRNLVSVGQQYACKAQSPEKLFAYCEPVAAAGGVLPKIPCGLGETVIAGDPRSRIAKLLKFIAEHDGRTCGASAQVDIVDPAKLLDEISFGRRKAPKCIVECCPEMIGDLVKCVAPHGTIVVKSRGYVGLDGVLVNDVVMKEISLVGAKYDSFDWSVDFIAANAETLFEMIDERDFTLEDFEEAFEEARKPNAKKVMFKCVQ